MQMGVEGKVSVELSPAAWQRRQHPGEPGTRVYPSLPRPSLDPGLSFPWKSPLPSFTC